MVRRTKKTTTFLILSIVALLALGVGYASWTDQLNVDGTVNTASMNVRWANTSVTDSGPAGVTCTIQQSGDRKTAVVTMANAYPGAECSFIAAMENNGGTPVEVVSYGYNVPGTPVDTNEPWNTDKLTTDDTCIGTNIAIPAGQAHTCELTVTVEDGTDPGESYQFDAEFDFEGGVGGV